MYIQNMFERIKESIKQKTEYPHETALRLDGFPNPEKEEIKRLEKREFKDVILEEKPEKIYAEYSSHDDLASWGTFYIRRANGEVVSVSDYYPALKYNNDEIDPDREPYSILDGQPYRLVAYDGTDPYGGPLRKSKFVRLGSS